MSSAISDISTLLGGLPKSAPRADLGGFTNGNILRKNGKRVEEVHDLVPLRTVVGPQRGADESILNLHVLVTEVTLPQDLGSFIHVALFTQNEVRKGGKQTQFCPTQVPKKAQS